MWLLWEFICSSWKSKRTHQSHSWMSQRFQMWLLWKIILSGYWSEETHQRCQMWFLWKSFSHSHNLRNHIKTIHIGNKDFKCETCGKSFKTKSYLNKQFNNVHWNCKQNIMIEVNITFWWFKMYLFDDGVNQVLELIHRSFCIANLFFGVFL